MEFIRTEHIYKTYPNGIRANIDVNLVVKKGEIHSIVGENGAGKSTLMKILYGMEKPDSGKIFIEGKERQIASPREAIKEGIGLVHQEFMLFSQLSVAENVVMGNEPHGLFKFDTQKSIKAVEKLCKKNKFFLDPNAKVKDLSVGEKQKIEILKLLYKNARLLIFDEPTSVLTPQEIEEFFKTLKVLADSGHTIIFITHKIGEVFHISNRISVMKKGKLIKTVLREEITPEELVEIMFGQQYQIQEKTQTKREKMKDLVLFSVKNLTFFDENKRKLLDNVSLTVKTGEIVAITGVEGNGQKELIEIISGITQNRIGKIYFNSFVINNLSTRKRREIGMRIIPAERTTEGVCEGGTILDNLISDKYFNKMFSYYGILNIKNIIKFVFEKMKTYEIKATGPYTLVGELSGGNIQRVVIAREIDKKMNFLIAAYPTRGLDVNSALYVHKNLINLKKQNIGILLFSADLDELFSISDRIGVMYRGRLIGPFLKEKISTKKVGELMMGIGVENEYSLKN